MIAIHIMPVVWGVPNLSPFCIKLETYCRMTKLPYELRPFNPAEAPMGKAPYINIDGRLMGDSQLIIEHLKRTYGDPLDASLSAEARARGHMIRRTLEEGTYWVMIHNRWATAEGWEAIRPTIATMIPPAPDRDTLAEVREYMIGQGRTQGLLRLTHEDINEIGKSDMDALVTLLGDQRFILGDEPTSCDATVYALVASQLAFPGPSPLKSHVQKQASLTAYCERVRARYFPELPAL